VWTLSPGVPIGCRLPRKQGPYSTPKHTSISCLDGWSSCCLDSWRLRKQRPPFNGSESKTSRTTGDAQRVVLGEVVAYLDRDREIIRQLAPLLQQPQRFQTPRAADDLVTLFLTFPPHRTDDKVMQDAVLLDAGGESFNRLLESRKGRDLAALLSSFLGMTGAHAGWPSPRAGVASARRLRTFPSGRRWDAWRARGAAPYRLNAKNSCARDRHPHGPTLNEARGKSLEPGPVNTGGADPDILHNNGIELLVPKHLLFVTLNA
jgi:hypothetical protein